MLVFGQQVDIPLSCFRLRCCELGRFFWRKLPFHNMPLREE